MESKDLVEDKTLTIYIIKYYFDTIKQTTDTISKINLSTEMFNIIYENIEYFKNDNTLMITLYTTLKRLKNEIANIDYNNNLELNEWCDIYNILIRYINNNYFN